MRPDTKRVAKAAEACGKAVHPTTALIHELAVAAAHALADMLDGRVEISVPGNFRIVREPTSKQRLRA